MTTTVLLVNPHTGIVHAPDCPHARGCIPWAGFAATPSDRACRVCAPEFPARLDDPHEETGGHLVTCELCGHHELPESGDMAGDLQLMDDHLRVMHPDVYGDGPERWPDGGIVVHDATIEPEDFA
jgi:hypothetical protein